MSKALKDAELKKQAINKWKKIAYTHSYNGTVPLRDIDVGNCGYCLEYHERYIPKSAGVSCQYCPIAIKTGKPYCTGTPYGMYSEALRSRAFSNEVLAQLAQAELDFLRSV